MMTLAAGYGETILTPPLGVELTGYGFYLERRAESVLDDLKARALFLEKDGVRAVLVSCDLVGLTVEASDAARRAISASLGIPPDHVLLACTHTHTGPATMDMPGAGRGGSVPPAVAVRGVWAHPGTFGADRDKALPLIRETLDEYVRAGIEGGFGEEPGPDGAPMSMPSGGTSGIRLTGGAIMP
jgi:hypothetical protein